MGATYQVVKQTLKLGNCKRTGIKKLKTSGRGPISVFSAKEEEDESKKKI